MLIIFVKHNMQTFKHSNDSIRILINKLLLIQFYLFNIRPKLHHWKWQELRVTLPTETRKLCYRKDDRAMRAI